MTRLPGFIFFASSLVILLVSESAYGDDLSCSSDSPSQFLFEVDQLLQASEPSSNVPVATEPVQDLAKKLRDENLKDRILAALDKQPDKSIELSVDRSETIEAWKNAKLWKLVTKTGELTDKGEQVLKQIEKELTEWPGKRREVSAEMIEDILNEHYQGIDASQLTYAGPVVQKLPSELKDFLKENYPSEIVEQLSNAKLIVQETAFQAENVAGGFSIYMSPKARYDMPNMITDFQLANIEAPISLQIKGLNKLPLFVTQYLTGVDGAIFVNVPRGALEKKDPKNLQNASKAQYVLAEELFHYLEKVQHPYLSDVPFLNAESDLLELWNEPDGRLQKAAAEKTWRWYQSFEKFPRLKELYIQMNYKDEGKSKKIDTRRIDKEIRAMLLEDTAPQYAQLAYFLEANELHAKYLATQYLKKKHGASFAQVVRVSVPGLFVTNGNEDAEAGPEAKESEKGEEMSAMNQALDFVEKDGLSTREKFDLTKSLYDYLKDMYESEEKPLRLNDLAYTIQLFQKAGVKEYSRAVDVSAGLYSLNLNDGEREKLRSKLMSKTAEINSFKDTDSLRSFLRQSAQGK